jgi:hypothetical protein
MSIIQNVIFNILKGYQDWQVMYNLALNIKFYAWENYVVNQVLRKNEREFLKNLLDTSTNIFYVDLLKMGIGCWQCNCFCSLSSLKGHCFFFLRQVGDSYQDLSGKLGEISTNTSFTVKVSILDTDIIQNWCIIGKIPLVYKATYWFLFSSCFLLFSVLPVYVRVCWIIESALYVFLLPFIVSVLQGMLIF